MPRLQLFFLPKGYALLPSDQLPPLLPQRLRLKESVRTR